VSAPRGFPFETKRTLMQVRQNYPKNHKRDDDQIYDVCSRYGPLRRSGRGARIAELPALGSVAQARPRQAHGLLMAFAVDVNGRAPTADAERAAFLRKVQPEAWDDAEPSMESPTHIIT
jgi:hypothetical protein